MSDSESIFVDRFYDQCRKNVADKRAMTRLNRQVKNYIDDQIEVLMKPDFASRLYFDHGPEGDGEHAAPVFDILDIQARDIMQAVKDVRKNDVVILDRFTRPLTWILLMQLRALALEKPTSTHERDVENILGYMAASWWWGLQKKYFKFEPNPNIVAYTVARLSKRFKVRRLGSAFDAVVDSFQTHYNSHIDQLRDGTDEDLKNFISGQWNHINSLIKNFTNEFLKDHKAGNFINPDGDTQAEKGDEGRAEQEMSTNNSVIRGMVDRSVDALTTNRTDGRVVAVTSKLSEVRAASIRNSIDQIREDFDSDYLRRVFEAILILFTVEGSRSPREIYSRDYILYAYQIYSRSNTNDPVVLGLKKQLDEMLNQVSPQYSQTERVATKTKLRKSIFIYFALIIQQSNRGINLS